MKKDDMVPKAVTIREDQDTWLKKSDIHIADNCFIKIGEKNCLSTRLMRQFFKYH
jgi:hypothetical protein